MNHKFQIQGQELGGEGYSIKPKIATNVSPEPAIGPNRALPWNGGASGNGPGILKSLNLRKDLVDLYYIIDCKRLQLGTHFSQSLLV